MHTIALEKTNIFRDIALVSLASILISLSGFVSIPLWFTPIPLATQNAVVLLMAALLGSRRGAAATFLFILQGVIGFPVFSNGGFGLMHLFGPTGGYVVGYLVASFVVGYIAEKRKTIASAVGALTLGNIIVLFFGASYFATFVGFEKAFMLGVAPFLVGDIIKTLASLKILQLAGWSKYN